MAKTIEQVLEIEDDNEFCIALDDRLLGKDVEFDDLSRSEQVVYCINDLEREVDNGGWVLFFGNSSGDHAYETLHALEEIGAFHTAQLMRQALAVFPEPGLSPVRVTRESQIAEMHPQGKDELNELDEQFFEYRDNLALLIRRFVEANQNDFE